MELDYLLRVFAHKLATLLPWVISGLALFAAASLSPVGRSLVRYLKARHNQSELAETVLGEMADLRQIMGELLERMDSTEQHLKRLVLPPRPGEPAGAPPEVRDVDHVPTPV